MSYERHYSINGCCKISVITFHFYCNCSVLAPLFFSTFSLKNFDTDWQVAELVEVTPYLIGVLLVDSIKCFEKSFSDVRTDTVEPNTRGTLEKVERNDVCYRQLYLLPFKMHITPQHATEQDFGQTYLPIIPKS